MSYRDLYSFCQDLPVPISRNLIRDKVRDLRGIAKIATMKTRLDISLCRGFYLSAHNEKHVIVAQHGSHVIVLPREELPDWPGLNRCWERFIFTKELMHIFDDPDEATDSGDAFETVLSELNLPFASEWSPQMESELKCFWMALGVLCPEPHRLALKAERDAAQTDDYAIALKLRIPQHVVPRLFEDRFVKNIEELIS